MHFFVGQSQYLAPKWQAYITPKSAGYTFPNGLSVHSFWELKQALLTLGDDEIAPAIGLDGHFLADWIETAMGDPTLATMIKKTDQRWGVLVTLERHLMRTLNLPPYVAKRWLGSSATRFCFSSGQEITSLEQLQVVLPDVSQETLDFHYTRFPNDLSSWLACVIGDYYLSESLEEALYKDQIVAIVDDHLTMLHEASRS